MTVNTLKNFGQSGNSVKTDKLNNFLLEELDDAASSQINGGVAVTHLTGEFPWQASLQLYDGGAYTRVGI